MVKKCAELLKSVKRKSKRKEIEQALAKLSDVDKLPPEQLPCLICKTNLGKRLRKSIDCGRLDEGLHGLVEATLESVKRAVERQLFEFLPKSQETDSSLFSSESEEEKSSESSKEVPLYPRKDSGAKAKQNTEAEKGEKAKSMNA